MNKTIFAAITIGVIVATMIIATTNLSSLILIEPEYAFEPSNDHLAEHLYDEYHNGIKKIIKESIIRVYALQELEPKKEIKQHGFFVSSLLMVWFLLQIGSGHLHALEPLEVDLSVSPTTVDADHTFVVNVLISNRGDSDQAVSSVDLVFPPWQSSDETGMPLNLTPGQTGILGLNVRAPSNASDGKHDIFVEVGLPEGITILANSSIQAGRQVVDNY